MVGQDGVLESFRETEFMFHSVYLAVLEIQNRVWDGTVPLGSAVGFHS